MMKKLVTVLSLALFAFAALPANAKDCGPHPGSPPPTPDGSRVTRTQLNLAIAALQTYGEITNAYLDCLDSAQGDMFFNMTEEQQERWIEDYNNIVDQLAEAQTAINEQIRIFNVLNTAQSGGPESGQ